MGNFSLTQSIEGNGPKEIRISRKEFKGDKGKTLEWAKIETFEVTLVDESTKAKLNLTSAEGHKVLQLIQLVDAL